MLLKLISFNWRFRLLKNCQTQSLTQMFSDMVHNSRVIKRQSKVGSPPRATGFEVCYEQFRPEQ
jgi:hypothetical protein